MGITKLWGVLGLSEVGDACGRGGGAALQAVALSMFPLRWIND